MKKFNEIEQLSAYLDGQLSESDSKRLKARLESDPELDSVLRDLSSARSILRALPKRKSPKNFTLTRKMVGLKPPLPKTYPLFRLATAFATVLFVFTFSVNALSPYLSFSAPQINFGMGGGGADAPAVAQEAPANEESMMFESAPATEAAATEAPADEPIPQATETAKQAGPEDSSAQDATEELQNQLPDTNEALFSSKLIFIFLVISILGAISMFVIRQNAKRKWQ